MEKLIRAEVKAVSDAIAVVSSQVERRLSDTCKRETEITQGSDDDKAATLHFKESKTFLLTRQAGTQRLPNTNSETARRIDEELRQMDQKLRRTVQAAETSQSELRTELDEVSSELFDGMHKLGEDARVQERQLRTEWQSNLLIVKENLITLMENSVGKEEAERANQLNAALAAERTDREGAFARGEAAMLSAVGASQERLREEMMAQKESLHAEWQDGVQEKVKSWAAKLQEESMERVEELRRSNELHSSALMAKQKEALQAAVNAELSEMRQFIDAQFNELETRLRRHEELIQRRTDTRLQEVSSDEQRSICCFANGGAGLVSDPSLSLIRLLCAALTRTANWPQRIRLGRIAKSVVSLMLMKRHARVLRRDFTYRLPLQTEEERRQQAQKVDECMQERIDRLRVECRSWIGEHENSLTAHFKEVKLHIDNEMARLQEGLRHEVHAMQEICRSHAIDLHEKEKSETVNSHRELKETVTTAIRCADAQNVLLERGIRERIDAVNSAVSRQHEATEELLTRRCADIVGDLEKGMTRTNEMLRQQELRLRAELNDALSKQGELAKAMVKNFETRSADLHFWKAKEKGETMADRVEIQEDRLQQLRVDVERTIESVLSKQVGHPNCNVFPECCRRCYYGT